MCKNFGSISFVIKNWPSRLNFFQCYEVNFRIKTQVYRLLILSGFKWLLNTCGDFQKLQNFSCKKMGMLHIKWKFFIFIKSEKNDFWRSLLYSLSIELLWSHKKNALWPINDLFGILIWASRLPNYFFLLCSYWTTLMSGQYGSLVTLGHFRSFGSAINSVSQKYPIKRHFAC